MILLGIILYFYGGTIALILLFISAVILLLIYLISILIDILLGQKTVRSDKIKSGRLFINYINLYFKITFLTVLDQTLSRASMKQSLCIVQVIQYRTVIAQAR